MADHSRLGRGLASLIGDVGEETQSADPARKPRHAPIENLKANPRNPRRAFSDAELDELAASIREHGIIQPIVVRKTASDDVSRSSPASGAGARRSAPISTTCRSSWWKRPTGRRSNSPSSKTCSAPISTPIEEASGYQALMDEFNHSQDEVAQIVGKSRSHVANMVRLLKLSEPVKALVASGELSAGHARQLVGQPNALELAQDIIKRGMNVRQVEEAGTQGRTHPGATPPACHGPRTPTPRRWRSGCPMRSALRSASITAGRAARCVSNIAISISSTRLSASSVDNLIRPLLAIGPDGLVAATARCSRR